MNIENNIYSPFYQNTIHKQQIYNELYRWKNSGTYYCEDETDRQRVFDEFVRFLNDNNSHILNFKGITSLKSLPEIFCLEPFINRLEVLNCSNTQLSTVPTMRWEIMNIRELDFSYTKITNICPEIGLCPTLEIIDCTASNLQTLFLKFNIEKRMINLEIVCNSNPNLKVSEELLEWPEHCLISLLGCDNEVLHTAMKNSKKPIPTIIFRDEDDDMDLEEDNATNLDAKMQCLKI